MRGVREGGPSPDGEMISYSSLVGECISRHTYQRGRRCGGASALAPAPASPTFEAVFLALVDVVTVVEVQLVTALDLPLGEEADVVVSADGEDARRNVGGVGMVNEARLVALAARIYHLLVVEVEEVGRDTPVVDLAAPVSLLL